VSKADYKVHSLNYTPETQIKGKEIQFTVSLVNNGESTLVESSIQWLG
jgi:hypothetical protein